MIGLIFKWFHLFVFSHIVVWNETIKVLNLNWNNVLVFLWSYDVRRIPKKCLQIKFHLSPQAAHLYDFGDAHRWYLIYLICGCPFYTHFITDRCDMGVKFSVDNEDDKAYRLKEQQIYNQVTLKLKFVSIHCFPPV